MLRDRLKSMELKITELADYLQVSRPTMYKFIEYYDNQQFELINKKVLKLFNYINEHELVGKKNVVNYILTNLVTVKEMNDSEEYGVLYAIKKYIISNPESKKSKFITLCVTNDHFDDIIPFLVEIQPLIRKRKLNDDEIKKLEIYKNFINEINIIKGEK